MSDARELIAKELELVLNKLRHSGQKLTEAEIPYDTYKNTTVFVLSVRYDERYKTNIFQLLVERGKIVPLSKAGEVVRQWKDAIKALLRYPMDLYLAPNRPELKVIKLSAGAFEYHINRKLLNAKEFLSVMGYRPYGKSQSDFILRDTSNLVSIITDLVVLHGELSVVLEIVEEVTNTMNSQSVSGRLIFLEHVLIARQHSKPRKQDSINYLMHDLSHSPSHSNGAPSSLPTTIESTVVSDGHVRARKNDMRIISRGGDRNSPVPIPRSPGTRSQGIVSPPPNPSDLPSPVFSRSQVMQMNAPLMQDKIQWTGSDEKTFHPPYKMFCIDDGHERPRNNSRHMVRGSSLDHDNNSVPKKTLRQNSSMGNLLDTPSSNHVSTSDYQTSNNYPHSPSHSEYHPPTSQYLPPMFEYPLSDHPPASQYRPSTNQYNKGVQPGDDYAIYGENCLTVNNYFAPRRGSENSILSRNNPNQTPRANDYKDFEKNYDRYNPNSIMIPENHPNTTSNTWGGGDPRQVLRQLSRDKQITLSGAAAVSNPSTGWSCQRCSARNESGIPGCVACGEIAYWVDLTPLDTTQNVTSGVPKLVETDSSELLNRSPVVMKTWECPYCMSINNNNTEVCTECHQANKAY